MEGNMVGSTDCSRPAECDFSKGDSWVSVTVGIVVLLDGILLMKLESIEKKGRVRLEHTTEQKYGCIEKS